jgi:transcription termination factor NusA
MDVKVILLRPVTDGTGTHGIGSEFTCDEKEAARLIRLEAAYKLIPEKRVFEEIAKSADSSEVEEDETETTEVIGTGEDEDNEEYMSEEEYAQVLSALQEIEGVNRSLAEKLVEAGFQSVEDVSNASAEALTEVSGIGKKSVGKIIASAQSLLSQ